MVIQMSVSSYMVGTATMQKRGASGKSWRGDVEERCEREMLRRDVEESCRAEMLSRDAEERCRGEMSRRDAEERCGGEMRRPGRSEMRERNQNWSWVIIHPRE